MTNVIKGTAVDFEKVNSLDGTYIINRYNKNLPGQISKKKLQPIKEFDETDIIAEEQRKSRMRRPSSTNGQNKKQAATSIEVQKIPESIPEREVENNIRSYITHNKGGNWEPIRAPTVTSKGAPISCSAEDECSLHLEIYSS